jgi:hypothetical protein
MEVRDQDRVDLLRIDPGGGEVRAERSGGGGKLAAGRGVDQDELGAGVDHQRGERDRELSGRHVGVHHRLLHRRPRRVLDELVVDVAQPDAVMDGGQLIGADLVAIEGGGLRAGDGRCGLR